ncbi:hypothetical protein RND81_09G001000 [Saponaria officinalis]|uniref:Fatty acid hydroxylase domain-containing protein n=1 Tax=Saponaria officinalis TaxID=3572 RepID=A0AAW1IH30_SAPOF
MEESYSYVKVFVEQTSMYNRILLPQSICGGLPHLFQSWLRNCLYAAVLYFVASLMCFPFWKAYMYSSSSSSSHGNKSSYISRKGMVSQIGVTMKAVPLGVFLHTGMEYVVEMGWTRCFPRISDVGVVAYLCYVIVYLGIVEAGTYWVHRLLHEIKPMYKYLHQRHHLYRKEASLSPFAVHPVEGILMGLPHGVAMFIVPTHFTTHLALFMVQGAWGVAIHDRSNQMYWPLMDAGYHTVHHTSSHHNYGNFTIWMDQLFGTLHTPKQYTGFNSTNY